MNTDTRTAAIDRTSANQPAPVERVNYRVTVSTTVEDPEWDAFLARTPGGHFGQTSCWARAVMAEGWHVVRVAVLEDSSEQMLAGAQMLVRQLGPLGSIGYVLKGPLLATQNPDVANRLIA